MRFLLYDKSWKRNDESVIWRFRWRSYSTWPRFYFSHAINFLEAILFSREAQKMHEISKGSIFPSSKFFSRMGYQIRQYPSVSCLTSCSVLCGEPVQGWGHFKQSLQNTLHHGNLESCKNFAQKFILHWTPLMP